MVNNNRRAGWRRQLLITVLLAALPGCADALLNNTASLGGDVPGGRGKIYVVFVNKTPYRAVFTFGTYDPLNIEKDSPIRLPNGALFQFEQFSLDENTANRLERDSTSVTLTFDCGRVMAVGDELLVQLIERDEPKATTSGLTIHDDALRPLTDATTGAAMAGIAFSDRPLDMDQEEGLAPVAWASGFTTLQGAEYPSDALLIYTFEVDDGQAGGVRVDFSIIPQE